MTGEGPAALDVTAQCIQKLFPRDPDEEEAQFAASLLIAEALLSIRLLPQLMLARG